MSWSYQFGRDLCHTIFPLLIRNAEKWWSLLLIYFLRRNMNWIIFHFTFYVLFKWSLNGMQTISMSFFLIESVIQYWKFRGTKHFYISKSWININITKKGTTFFCIGQVELFHPVWLTFCFTISLKPSNVLFYSTKCLAYFKMFQSFCREATSISLWFC